MEAHPVLIDRPGTRVDDLLQCRCGEPHRVAVVPESAHHIAPLVLGYFCPTDQRWHELSEA